MPDFVEFLSGLLVCGVAGFSGALASVFGKLSSLEGNGWGEQGVCILLLVVCNGLMVILYSRALHGTTSLQATVATLAVNITSTGWLGRIVFGEANALQWWIGASTILAGTFFIRRSNKTSGAGAAAAAERKEEEAAPAASPARATRRTRRA